MKAKIDKIKKGSTQLYNNFKNSIAYEVLLKSLETNLGKKKTPNLNTFYIKLP